MALLDNLIAYYNFDEDLKDSTNNEYDLTNAGATPTTGRINGAYAFDVSSSQDMYRTYFNLDESISVAAWIKLDSNNIAQAICVMSDSGTPDGFQFGVHTDAKVRFAYGKDAAYTNLYSTSTLNTGEWYHIVATYQHNVGAKIYINGELDNSNTASRTVNDNAGEFHVGGRMDNNAFFDGIIDELGIWGQVLDLGEIALLYNSGEGLPYSSFCNTLIGGKGTKAITTRYPVTSGLIAGTTKQEGRISNLVAQNSNVLNSEYVGI